MIGLRIGQGFDVHRFQAGRRLMLCGIEIPSAVGLEGHSDADVALHALTDAVLGAVGLGDIGQHFPPSDSRFKDGDSRLFLAHAVDLAAAEGYAPVNCDLTIIGERPRLAPHRGTMVSSLAGLLGVPPTQVSVKATTTEGLGWTGRGEGLAAMAIVLLAASEVSGP